ncbi:MAG TPA: glycine cleavage system protein GcvH [Firmicutes bacterium]|nr:glycine cleavage system protein GcvH [Bacillota bacterium]
MECPKGFYYTKTHEWVKVDGNCATVGITSHAAEQLGDIVFVELPEVGREVKHGEAFVVVESVKAVSDCYAPVSGRVIEVNQELVNHPELVNQDAFGAGWMVKIEMSDARELGELMDEVQYKKVLEEEGLSK